MPINRRRVVLVAVLSFVSAFTVLGPARAQDPRGSVVQAASRAWLGMTDRGDAAGSWRSAGKQFQNAISADKWAESLKQVRPPLGAVTDRTLLSTEFTRTIPGAADGDYALVVFRSGFVNKTDGREMLTLEREADGAWHVIGYFVR